MVISSRKINCFENKSGCYKDCSDKDCWKNQVHEIGCRMTKAREAILTVLKESTEHYSAEEIFLKTRKYYPGIGLATIYRTLDILCENGFIKTEFLNQECKRYEWVGSNDSMIEVHLKCNICNKIAHHQLKDNLEMNSYLLIMDKIQKENNFQINRTNILIDGICNKCKK